MEYFSIQNHLDKLAFYKTSVYLLGMQANHVRAGPISYFLLSVETC